MWAAWWIALAAQAQVVDRLVAVVGGSTVVTLSDIELERALEQRDRSELPFWGRGATEDVLIDAALLRIAAADVALYQPATEATQVRAAAIRATFASEAEWQTFISRWGLDASSLGVVLRRRLVVERYLQHNLKADPGDRTAWLAEVDQFVADLELRISVRRIAAEAP